MRRPPRALPWLLLRRADDEPLAALRTAALEDVAAGLGRVALAEPVLAVAATLLGWYVRFTTTGLLRAKSPARKHAPSGKSRNLDGGPGSFDPQRKFHMDGTIPRRSSHFGDPA